MIRENDGVDNSLSNDQYEFTSTITTTTTTTDFYSGWPRKIEKLLDSLVIVSTGGHFN